MIERLVLPLEVTIRLCVETDLPHLEWFGLFTPHRGIIRSAFDGQMRGDTAMLVADINGFPAGQVWIDFRKRRAEGRALLWAVRVMPPFQRAGLGARLIGAAERLIHSRDVPAAEAGVERDNAVARRFYERLGYRLAGTERGSYSFTTPEGVTRIVPRDEWVLVKTLRG
jgi:ribosomal protein S18 acetylase RimI-like enzyme